VDADVDAAERNVGAHRLKHGSRRGAAGLLGERGEDGGADRGVPRRERRPRRRADEAAHPFSLVRPLAPHARLARLRHVPSQDADAEDVAGAPAATGQRQDRRDADDGVHRAEVGREDDGAVQAA
jgi:hypothetical protein